MTKKEEQIIERLRSRHPSARRDALLAVERWRQRGSTSEDFEHQLRIELAKLASSGAWHDEELSAVVGTWPCEDLEELFISLIKVSPEDALTYAPHWAHIGRVRVRAMAASERLMNDTRPWIAFKAAIAALRLGFDEEKAYNAMIREMKVTLQPAGLERAAELLNERELERLKQELAKRARKQET